MKKIDYHRWKSHRKKKGFSLSELVVVIIIIGILSGAAVGIGGKQIKKSRMEKTQSNLEVLAQNVEDAVVEYGFIDTVSNMTNTQNYFSLWEDNFLPCFLNFSTVVYAPTTGYDFGTGATGVMFETMKYADAWDMECRLYYIITATGDKQIILASAGPDSEFSEAANNGYQSGERDDDITIKMTPRERN